MKTWLEVALNGSWGKALQPGIPVSVAEIIAEGIACAREGAAIVHVHAYDEASGRQCEEAHVYQRIIEGIRSQVDCIVYPTIPLTSNMPAAERFAAVEALARGGLAVDVLKLAPAAIARGGHVRVGLEDAPLGSLRSNLEWVQAARLVIERTGATLASVDDVRQASKRRT